MVTQSDAMAVNAAIVDPVPRIKDAPVTNVKLFQGIFDTTTKTWETNAIVNEKPKHNIAKRKAKYKPQTYKEVKQKLHEDYEKIPEYYNDKFMFKINEACEILGMERNQIFDMRLQKKIIIHQICGGRVSGREINRILAGKPLWRLYAA